MAGGLSKWRGLARAAADVEAGALYVRFLTGLRRRRKRRAGRESQAKDARREIEFLLASCRELEGKEGGGGGGLILSAKPVAPERTQPFRNRKMCIW